MSVWVGVALTGVTREHDPPGSAPRPCWPAQEEIRVTTDTIRSTAARARGATAFARGATAFARAAALARAAAAVLASIALLAPTRTAASPPPEFAGLWQLDVRESDTLQQKLETMRGSGSGGGFPGGGGWHGGTGGGWAGGMGGHHGGYGGMRGGGDHGAGGSRGAGADSTRRAQMQELAQPPMSLLIEPGDDTFVLSERGRTIEVLVLGDGATPGASIQPDAPHVTAQWKGKHLISQSFGAGGGKMTQEMELEDHDRKLIIRTTLEGRGGGPPLELKRVYNRSEGEDAAPAPPSAAGTQAQAPALRDSSRR